MTRSTFTRKLKAIGDLPVPKGHARTRKGVTTYFFPHRKVEEVSRMVSGCFQNLPKWAPGYAPVVLHFLNPDRNGDKSVLMHIQNDFVSVGIVHWQ